MLTDFEKLPTNDFWTGVDRILSDAIRPLSETPRHNLTPMNVRKTKEGTEVELAVPGFAKADIRISVEDGKVLIQASKEGKVETYSRQEFGYSEVWRQFPLPKNAVVEQIAATVADGILTLKIPVQEKEKRAFEITIN